MVASLEFGGRFPPFDGRKNDFFWLREIFGAFFRPLGDIREARTGKCNYFQHVPRSTIHMREFSNDYIKLGGGGGGAVDETKES